MKNVKHFLLLCSMAAIFQTGCKTKSEVTGIRMDWDKQTLSIEAKKQSLSSILSQLEEKEDIIVQPENFADREITVNIKEQPVHTALVQLIGSDRFVLNSKNHELGVKGKEGIKKEKKHVFPEGKKQKYAVRDSSSVKQMLPSENIKPKPDDIKMFESAGKPGEKRASSSLSTSIDKKFTKQAKTSPITQDKEKFTRLRFKMEDNLIKVEKALITPGKLVVPPVDVRDYIYSIELIDKVISVGSFDDPLEMHTYFPDSTRGHEVLRSKIGYFEINIPDHLVDPEKIRSITIHFFKSDMITTPTINLEQFEKLEKSLKTVSTLSLTNETFKIEKIADN